MKLLSGLLLAAGAAAAFAQSTEPATPLPAQKSTAPRIILPSDSPKSKTVDLKATKDAKAAADAAKAPKKAAAKAEKAKIKGVEVARGEKGFLGIQIVDASFRLTFYDKDKEPISADVDRAALRWDPKYKVGEERVVLTPTGDGKALTSEKNIRPPYNFKLFMTLIREAKDGQTPVNETYVVDFRQ